MATIKSYSDLDQSRKLAEILPLESADMHWTKDFDGSWFVDLAKYTSVKIPKYVGNIEEHLLPCWSLVALLGILEHPRCFQGDKPIYWFCGCFGKDNLYHEVEADNPVDACYSMILKLKKLNLL